MQIDKEKEEEKERGPGGSNPLEQFVVLAKAARGAAAVELVKQVLEAPGVHVFGELLDTDNIKEVSSMLSIRCLVLRQFICAAIYLYGNLFICHSSKYIFYVSYPAC